MATITKGRTFLSGETVTPQKLNTLVDDATISGIVNSEIAAGAGIVDTKLAVISTPGKVANSATSATNTNTPNTIVARDGSGNFSAGTITANITGNVSGSSGSCTGNAATATQASNALACSGNAATATLADTCSGNSNTATRLQTARTINGVAFDGSGNITVTAEPNAHTHTIANVTGLQAALDSKLSGSNLGFVKAWVNFNHGRMLGVTNAANGESITVTAGSSSGTWNSTTAFSTGQLGVIYYITSAGAVPNASLGGINVSTLGFQIRAISGNTATIKLLAGPATTSQTISGNGGTSGFQYMSYGIRAQYGISSITKAASGSHMNFTFNFSTPFDFIDYFYQFQMDARSSGDFYIQTKGQSSIQIQVLNFSDASVSSQMNFMAMGI